MFESLKNLLLIIDKKNFSRFYFLLFIILTLSIFEVISIGLVLPVVTFLVNENSINIFRNYINIDLFNNISNDEILHLSILLLLFVFLIKFIFQIYFYTKQNQIVFDIMHVLSRKLFNNYLSKPFYFFLNKNSSNLISNLTIHTPDVIYNFLIPVVLLISEMIMIIFIITVLFLLDLRTVILALVIGAVGFIFLKIISKKIKSWGNIRVINEKIRVQIVQQSLNAIKETIVFGRQKYFSDLFNNINNSNRKVLSKYFTFLELPKPIIELIGFSCLIVFIIILISLNYEGKDIIPPIATFCLASYKILPSANKILISIQRIRFAKPALDKIIFEFESIHDTNKNFQQNNNKMSFEKHIKISNLDFSYNAENIIFDNLNLKINKGEMIAITGGSGEGKSTLVNILLGLLSCDNGKVEIDGISIENNIETWQKNIGYVPQKINLLDESIEENILLGEKSNTEKIKKVLKDVQLENFLNETKKFVGEDGVRISGGQKQRLGIARALYRDPELLVLDEATSSLDNRTENEIMELLSNLKGKKTIVFISHNLKTLEFCDKVYKIQDKKLNLLNA
tara:strand:- start:1616 stop:3319 length:1704 start_codon:yes stop_codon:yes gene_type:complete